MRVIANLGARALPVIRLARDFTLAHLVTKLLAATSGLLLVRLLSVQEYGFYTVLLIAFTSICTLSDLGATETLAYFRRRSAGKKTWWYYLRAVLRFRRTMFFMGVLMAASYILYAGLHIGRDIGSVLIGVLVVTLGAWFAVHAGILSYLLKLEHRFRTAYIVEAGNECVKLMSVALIWFLGYTTALGGIAGIACGAFCAGLLAAHLYKPGLGKPKSANPRNERRCGKLLRAQVLPIIPGTVYFSLQGPLIAWIALECASVVNVAEIGALARINVLVGMLAGFTATVVIPRIMVIDNEAAFYRRYLGWWLVLGTLGVALVLVVSVLSAPLLYLLGEAYSNLHDELVISASTAVVAAWGAFSWGINRVRGWTRYQPWRVPVMVAGQLSMFFAMDLSTTEAILLFALGSTILDLLFQTSISVFGFLSRSRLVSKTN